MNARASIVLPAGPVVGGVVDPVVMMDQVPQPRLRVRECRWLGPLDERVIRLAIGSESQVGGDGTEWMGQRAIVSVPCRLSDDTLRWQVLGQGGLVRSNVVVGKTDMSQSLELMDDWSVLLDGTLAKIWRQTSEGVVVESPVDGWLAAGAKGNRSTQRWMMDGQEIYVLMAEGDLWTVATALEYVSVLAGLKLDGQTLPVDVAQARLVEPVKLSGSLRDILRAIFEPYGLVMQRELMREGSTVVEHRSVRVGKQGRRVSLGTGVGAVHPIRQMQVDQQEPAARLWVARAGRRQVESTFNLVGGWNPALEGEDEEYYARTGNPAWLVYAQVYRLWALNEDGRFSVMPFDRGPAYDLGTLFGQGPMAGQPLRFEPCLTLDSAGARRSVVVEMSLDSGATWQIYPGDYRLRTDLAAVEFVDAVLPADYLAAALAGEVRVRVTATLNSPLAIQVQRWSGNPFGGIGPSVTLDVGDSFGWSKVDAASIHRAGLDSGNLRALERDSILQMEQWLVDRMRGREGEPVGASVTGMGGDVSGGSGGISGGGRVVLDRAWFGLRVGDGLVDTGGVGLEAIGRSRRSGEQPWVVEGWTCRWDGGQRSGGVVGSVIQTQVQVRRP